MPRNNMNMKMRYRLRDDGVGDGQNAVCLIGIHRGNRHLLRSPHYLGHNLGIGYQEMLNVSRGHYQCMAQKDRGAIQENARVCSDLDYMRIIRVVDEVAEGTGHG